MSAQVAAHDAVGAFVFSGGDEGACAGEVRLLGAEVGLDVVRVPALIAESARALAERAAEVRPGLSRLSLLPRERPSGFPRALLVHPAVSALASLRLVIVDHVRVGIRQGWDWAEVLGLHRGGALRDEVVGGGGNPRLTVGARELGHPRGCDSCHSDSIAGWRVGGSRLRREYGGGVKSKLRKMCTSLVDPLTSFRSFASRKSEPRARR